MSSANYRNHAEWCQKAKRMKKDKQVKGSVVYLIEFNYKALPIRINDATEY